MANKTINDLTVTTSAAAADLVPVWVAASSVTRKVTKANFIGAVLTGGGTVATGGFTLTVPATGTAALRGADNAFSADQSVAKANPQVTLSPTSGYGQFGVSDADNGASIGGRVLIGRNNNASTPAAGHLRIVNLSAAAYRIWPDAAGNLRIWTGDPINSADTSGTVVGAQTSSLDAKRIVGEVATIDEVLERIADGADAVRAFVYRSGAFNGERFEGVVVDQAPAYGMDRDEAHPAGKSLNEINILGDLLRAVAWLVEKSRD